MLILSSTRFCPALHEKGVGLEEGWELGWTETLGDELSSSEGSMEGMLETEGSIEGMLETDGFDEGYVEEGKYIR